MTEDMKKLHERIEELERQVRDLQAIPVYVPVFPSYQPMPVIIPTTAPIPTPITGPIYITPNYMCSQRGQNF